LLAEENCHGVTDELAQPAGNKMPFVAGSDLLGVTALGELAEHGFDPPPGLDQPPRPALCLGRRTERPSNEFEPVGRQFGVQRWAPVTAMTECPTVKASKDLRCDRTIGIIRRRHCRRGDHTGPSDPQMQAQSKIGLMRQRVVAKGGEPAKAAAAVGSREAARQTGTGRLSTMAIAASWQVAAARYCQSAPLTAQRFAARRRKVVRCTASGFGNRWLKCRRK